MADRVVEQVQLGTRRAVRERGGVQVGVEAARVGAQRVKQGRVGDGDGAGREAIRWARRGEQRHDDGAVHSSTSGVDVCLGRRADTAPRDRVAERVALNADQFQGLPVRSAGRHLVAALQARDQDGGCSGRVARHGDPRRGVTSLAADAALMASVPNATAAARAAPMPQARRRFVMLIMLIVLPDLRPTPSARPTCEEYVDEAGRRPTGQCEKAHSRPGEPNRCRTRKDSALAFVVSGHELGTEKVRGGSPAVADGSTRRTAPACTVDGAGHAVI